MISLVFIPSLPNLPLTINGLGLGLELRLGLGLGLNHGLKREPF